MYYQWIDSRWLGEADATVTADATLQAVHLDQMQVCGGKGDFDVVSNLYNL